DHADLWLSLRTIFRLFQDDKLSAILDLAPLNGELFATQTLDGCALSNRDLLAAFWYLAYYQERTGTPSRRVNYAALDVEELGSVYESLLEFHPHLDLNARPPSFELIEEGGERRSTGSHYTPPELEAPLIKHALEPLKQERLAAAAAQDSERGDAQTRRSAPVSASPRLRVSPSSSERAILSLKVCDLACGSGHFLLAAARRLGKELARVRTGEDEPAPERVRESVRDVITHCIYGVDKNPLAVELCRVALWLEGHAEDKPLTFLDHRIRCGDSLVGVFDLKALEAGIPDEAFKPVAGDDRDAARAAKTRNVRERRESLFRYAFGQQLQKFATELQRIDALPEDTIEQVRVKADAYRRLEHLPEFEKLELACNVWTAAFFQRHGDTETRRGERADSLRVSASPLSASSPVTTEALRTALSTGSLPDKRLAGWIRATAHERAFFHWPLAFPEVFAAGGFDVFLGNPPFLGGLRISTEFGDKYRQWLSFLFQPFPGTADICAAFFRRAFNALNPAGRFGLIATNTISQGDSREGGLGPIKLEGGIIAFAKRFVKWPGQATVEVNLVAVSKRPTPEQATLDGVLVSEISSRFDAEPEQDPQPLHQSRDKCFIGDFVRGIGFVVDRQEAENLLSGDSTLSRCLMPYLNGQDFNDDYQQRSDRHVICFHNFMLQQAEAYPALLGLVRERVKPFRDSVKEKHERENWWLFARYRGEMRYAIKGLERVLVRSRISDTHAVAFVDPNWIFNEKTIVFAFDDWFHFALIQSNMHEMWMRKFSGTLRTDISYAPTDCFETFAFPQSPSTAARAEAERLGEAYHEHRRQTMLARQLGLTKTYNLFHNPQCMDADIARLRELHAAMDRAILACYGWTDLDPAHGFHQNERGQTRYTISPAARRDLLRRLLALNLEIAAREPATT
ncbi:MAG: hypothetical protein HYY24_28360, partial [Verrucomicrobia bacterium]|nr:hypothetical protein [Verrucomicrobiota bacterium]